MEFTKTLLKEKLQLEIHLLTKTSFGSMVSILQTTNQLLWPDQIIEPSIQDLHQHLAKLKFDTQGLNEKERFEALNDYFFNVLDFKCVTQTIAPRHWLIEPAFTNRKGHPLVVTLFYLIFTETLQLPITLLNYETFTLLKWSRPKESELLDLSCSGAILKAQQIIDRFKVGNFLSEELEALTFDKIIYIYLSKLVEIFNREEQSLQKLSLLDTLLHLYPSNLEHLGQRALLYKALNKKKQAQDDLNRYFSYIDKNLAPEDIQSAFYDLCLEPNPHNLIH